MIYRSADKTKPGPTILLVTNTIILFNAYVI